MHKGLAFISTKDRAQSNVCWWLFFCAHWSCQKQKMQPIEAMQTSHCSSFFVAQSAAGHGLTNVASCCRFNACSGRGNMGYTLRSGRKISVPRILRLLYIVGIIFAIIGVVAAINLFNASTVSALNTAQHDRRTSNAVSPPLSALCMTPMHYNLVARCC